MPPARPAQVVLAGVASQSPDSRARGPQGSRAGCNPPSVFGNLTNPFHLFSRERTLGAGTGKEKKRQEQE
ncbi:hypothetical protein B0T18DRAFT_416663 [Schizothecium vesticola]|uniref:Uncharacterized protein n=1 Tax=Schizothecium vesticola TaxID=314040 RepID=A0AA40ERM4_9PEZI|nr:hypothetical protein B0T18DRAFT_416663 [Schizothecium vesticola]